MRMYETGERKVTTCWDRSPVWGRRGEGEETMVPRFARFLWGITGLRTGGEVRREETF